MRTLPAGLAITALLISAASPLAAQCDCPKPATGERALSFGIERFTYREQDGGPLMFALHASRLSPNDVGSEFSLSAAFAPYPFLLAEVGPIFNLTHGPVSLLARAGFGAVIIPMVPAGYAGIGVMVRLTGQMAVRVDVTRHYFNVDQRWDYLQSVGFGISTLTRAAR